MTVFEALSTLVAYAVERGMIDQLDEAYAYNRLLSVMQLDGSEMPSRVSPMPSLAMTSGSVTSAHLHRGRYAAASLTIF